MVVGRVDVTSAGRVSAKAAGYVGGPAGKAQRADASFKSVLAEAAEYAPPDEYGIGTTPAARKAAFRWAAQQLEAFLFQQMLQGMRRTVNKGSLFGNSAAEEIFQGMMDDELASSLGPQAGLGLAQVIEQQLGGAVE